MTSQLFFQLTLPLMVTILIAAFTATWSSNKRIEELSRRVDDTNRRIDGVERRLDNIETRFEARFDEVMRVLMSIDHRLTVLEERGSPLMRG